MTSHRQVKTLSGTLDLSESILDHFRHLEYAFFAWRRGGHAPLRPPIYLLGGNRAEKEVIFLGQLSYHAHKPSESEI